MGVPEADAETCAEVLIAADKQGIDSHGVSRLKPIYYRPNQEQGSRSPVTEFEVDPRGTNNGGRRWAQWHGDGRREEGDGDGDREGEEAWHGHGRRPKQHPLRHRWLLRPTWRSNEGLIGVVGTNARPSIPPTFGTENMLGTNPLTFGMPSDEAFPFMLDCATSIIQRGKVEVYARIGKKVPEGLVIDADGKYMTDPDEILRDLTRAQAALLPIGGLEETGGYKGYGYATVVEILSAISARRRLPQGTHRHKPRTLLHRHRRQRLHRSRATSRRPRETSSAASRATRKMPGHDRIYTAGEKEYLTWQERKKTGIPLNKSLQKELLQLKRRVRPQELPTPLLTSGANIISVSAPINKIPK